MLLEHEERARRRSPRPARRLLSGAGANGSATSTTISKYIARFRNEQPLPREARAELNKDEFWWKRRALSPHSATSSAAALTLTARERAPHRDAFDEAMRASSSSASSSRTSRSHHSSRSASTRRGGADTHGDDSLATAGALLSASGEAESLLLSSAPSNSFLRSDIESASRASSVGVSSEHALQDRRERDAIAFSLFRGSGAVMELRLSMEEEEERKEDDGGGEQTLLEDPELVIERVRKRLGFRRSTDLVALSAYQDNDESVFLGAPSPQQPWQQWMMARVEDACQPSNRAADDDVRTNGTSHHSPDAFASIKSLESALRGRNSEREFAQPPERSDAARLDRSCEDLGRERVASLLSPVATESDPMPTSHDELPNRADPQGNSDVLEPAVGESPATETTNPHAFLSHVSGVRASEAAEPVVSSSDQQQLGAKNRSNDVAVGRTSSRLSENGSDEHQPIPVEEPVVLHDDDHTLPPIIMANSPLCRIVTAPVPESPPLRASVSALVPSSSSSSSRPSSYSSTTAETAKTFDGLVSLVVQSWSSGLLHANDDGDGDSGSSKGSDREEGRGACEVGSPSCDETQVALDGGALSTQRQDSSSMEFHNDTVCVETHTKNGSREGHTNSRTQSMDSQSGAPQIANADQASNPDLAAVAASSALSSCDPSDAAAWNSAMASIDARDTERDALTGKWTSYDQQSETDASKDDGDDESGLFDEDEMVHMLLSRIALYEQALQQLEQPRDEEC